jgi:hypothetical protein
MALSYIKQNGSKSKTNSSFTLLDTWKWGRDIVLKLQGFYILYVVNCIFTYCSVTFIIVLFQ